MGSAHDLLSVCDRWIWSQQSCSADDAGTPYAATSLYAERSLCGDDTAASHLFPQMNLAFVMMFCTQHAATSPECRKHSLYFVKEVQRARGQ